MRTVLDKVRRGGYEYRSGLSMARVTAVPKRERNSYPAFFYDDATGWGIVNHDAGITMLGEEWNEVKDALTHGARKMGML